MSLDGTSANGLPGTFITFEGGEGAGKSTAIRAVEKLLREQHRVPDVVVTREPGGSSIGPAVRSIVLDSRDLDLHPRAEALLFAAERVQHVHEVIRPALARGAVVLCDRFIDSSVAYQGYARGMDPDEIRFLSDWGTAGITPDLTLILDIHPDVGIDRKRAQRETNRMEDLDIGYHHAVRDAFHSIAATDSSRYFVLDGHQRADYLVADVIGLVAGVLAFRANPLDRENAL